MRPLIRPGSKEEFLTNSINYQTRNINDRRKINIPVSTERRSNKERRSMWKINQETGASSFTG